MTPDDITGLVLAGGRATRMGGVDKGLQTYQGMPLALHVVLRLQPQVGTLILNANRNLAAYEALGVPVYPDVIPDYAGPLAGWLTGLEQCSTPWMVSAPCDAPLLPADLVARLAAAVVSAGADIAMPVTMEEGRLQRQPVFSLLRADLLESLTRYTQGGGRKIDAWTHQHRVAEVPFEDAAAFFNANTLQDLHAPR